MRLAFTFALSLLCAGLISAQVFVNATATGAENGTSWADAYTKIQDAFDSAQEGDQIWIAAGTYTPVAGITVDTTAFVLETGVEIYGGFNGTETMLEERDWETNTTILSGDLDGDDVIGDYQNFREDNARHVLVVAPDSAGVIIDGVSIVNGNSRMDDIPQNEPDISPWIGGGILVPGITNLELYNCTFSQNVGYIGSVFFISSDATGANELIMDNCHVDGNASVLGGARFQGMNSPVIRNSVFENNTAVTFGSALVPGNTNAVIEDCIFRNNEASGGFGAGIFIFENAFNAIANPGININNCAFETNEAFFGGGITFNNFGPETVLNIDSCSFTQNRTVADGLGAAIVIQNVTDGFTGTLPSIAVDINFCAFDKNTASLAGALLMYSDTDFFFANITESAFTENAAVEDYGAALFYNDGAIMQIAFDSLLFEDNFAGGEGGAIGLLNDNDEDRLQYSINNCGFIDNEAILGGAIASEGIGELGAIGNITNSLFEGNEGEECCGAISSIGENLTISNTDFIENATSGTGGDIIGGGALGIIAREARIQNCTFTGNSSEGEGSAILLSEGEKTYLENSLFNENTGGATITNGDSLWMTNLTIVNNDAGLSQTTEAYALIQNTIFDNTSGNLIEAMDSTVATVSNGANVSSDTTFNAVFTGAGGFDDFNETDPMLDMSFVPQEESVCVDNGNPAGVTWMFDLLGVDRAQGVSVDIGAYESPFDTPVRNLNTLDVEVYPNPFVSEIRFTSIEKMESIRLLDINGRMVQEFPLEQELRVNTALPAGVYFLQVKIQGQAYFKKLEKM